MKRFRSLFVLSLAVVVMTSCNPLKKMQKNADQIRYEVTPQILETHAGEVAIAVRGVFPEKYFDKNVVAEATPVLVFDGGEVAFDKVTLQGENVLANNKVISRSGDNFSYNSKIAYTDAMRKSELVLRMTATRKGKTIDFDPVKLADGVIATSTLAQKTPKAVTLKDNYQRIVSESQMAEILYLINSPVVRAPQLREQDIVQLREFITKVDQTENLVFKGVTVSSYASPDGKFDFNERLSRNRGTAADRIIKNDFRNIEDAQRDGFFNNITTAEDWEGFRELVAASNIRDKELILRVLSMYTDPVVREREIRNMSAAFEELKTDILPKLRRSKLIVNVEKVGRSDQEILAQIRSNPRELSLEEMLYAGTLTNDLNEKLRFYQIAADNHPRCFRAHNNVGHTLVQLGRIDEAGRAFQTALGINSTDAVKNNLGFIAIMQGDFDKAKEHFNSMTTATPESRFGLGMIAVKNGEYDQAVNHFGNENSYNLGHALLLKGDNNRAKAVLDAVAPSTDGKVNYMRAVLGARMADRDYMLTNLRESVSKDAAWKAYAKTDLEFSRYFVDNTFMSIVQ